MADQLKEYIWKLEQQLEWFNDFVDHVQTNRYNAYNYACEYADKQEQIRLEENE
tara:strand:- start:4262 stop:4423 length:162 start_codon:yes stop_codon:yes gene_type:complete